MKPWKWLRERLRDITYELEVLEPKSGSECISCSIKDDVTFGKDLPFDEKNKMGYTDRVVILGDDYSRYKFDNMQGRGGEAVWEFDISSLPKKEEIVGADLRIVTFRTHGGLHIPEQFATKDASGKLKLRKKNGEYYRGELWLAVGNEPFTCVDSIAIVKQMQHGEDYGFNRLDPYSIVDWLRRARDEGKMLKVKLRVDEHVFWDVNEIRIESIVLKRLRWKESILIIFGAFIGIATDLIAGAISTTKGVCPSLITAVGLVVLVVVIWIFGR